MYVCMYQYFDTGISTIGLYSDISCAHNEGLGYLLKNWQGAHASLF
jgi:hypothetical protein